MNPFTFSYIEDQYRQLLDAGYEAMTCRQYAERKAGGSLPHLALINRVDIDVSVRKAERLQEIYARIGIPATFFVRLHAREYNPFDFENYRILKAIRDDGHEIGYHSEVIDQGAIWDEDPLACLERDMAVLRMMLNTDVVGVASHGGMTGLNNLDFWRERHARDFGLLYEAYESSGAFDLFHHSLYVTDSEWTQWKAYRNGTRLEGDRRTPVEHARVEKPPLLYMLVHPETYFDRHPYD